MNKGEKRINNKCNFIDNLLLDNGLYKGVSALVEIEEHISNLYDEIDEYKCQLEEKEQEIRLDQTKKVFKVLAEAITNGSISYRDLIYDKLGFNGYYADLIDGLTITNAIVDLEEKDKVINESIERCDYYLSFEASDKLFENAISEVKDSLLNQYSNSEVWKDIKGYEGIYQVSNLGRVRSLDREITYPNGKIGLYKGKIIKLKMSKYGYIVFHFSVGNKKKALSVHRLVAEAFIPNPENKKCVNHLDCNRANNKVSNLEWCTHQENVQYSIKCGTFKGFHKKERGKNGK